MSLNGYSAFHVTRENSRGGGIAMYVSDDFATAKAAHSSRTKEETERALSRKRKVRGSISSDDVNYVQDGSTLVILQQPHKYGQRFRDLGEPRTPSMLAKGTDDRHKTYVKIEVQNIPAHEKVALFISCVTVNKPHRPHPNMLEGDHCTNGVYKFMFSGQLELIKLGIIKVEEVSERLTALGFRKQMRINPFYTSYEAADVDINSVRLCFQVYRRNEAGRYHRPLRPVLSEPIHHTRRHQDPDGLAGASLNTLQELFAKSLHDNDAPGGPSSVRSSTCTVTSASSDAPSSKDKPEFVILGEASTEDGRQSPCSDVELLGFTVPGPWEQGKYVIAKSPAEPRSKCLKTDNKCNVNVFHNSMSAEPAATNASPSISAGPIIDYDSDERMQSDRSLNESLQPPLSSTYLAGQSSSPRGATNRSSPPDQVINVHINIGDIIPRTNGRCTVNVYIGAGGHTRTYVVPEAGSNHSEATEQELERRRPSSVRRARADTDFTNRGEVAVSDEGLASPATLQRQQIMHAPQVPLLRERTLRWVMESGQPST